MLIGIASIITSILAPLAAVHFAQWLAAANSRRETVTRLLAKIYEDAYHLYDSMVFYTATGDDSARLQIRLEIKAARKALQGNSLISGMIFGKQAGPLQSILAKMCQEALTAVIDGTAKVDDLDQALEVIDGHFKELGQALIDLWSQETLVATSSVKSWASSTRWLRDALAATAPFECHGSGKAGQLGSG